MIRTLSDWGWTTFHGVTCTAVLEALVIGVAILSDPWLMIEAAERQAREEPADTDEIESSGLRHQVEMLTAQLAVVTDEMGTMRSELARVSAKT